MCVCTHVCVHACVHVCVCACVHMCVRACVRVYIHIQTLIELHLGDCACYTVAGAYDQPKDWPGILVQPRASSFLQYLRSEGGGSVFFVT